MRTIGFRDLGLDVDTAIHIANDGINENTQFRTLLANALQPLRQTLNLHGAAHIAGRYRPQLAERVTLLQRL